MTEQEQAELTLRNRIGQVHLGMALLAMYPKNPATAEQRIEQDYSIMMLLQDRAIAQFNQHMQTLQEL